MGRAVEVFLGAAAQRFRAYVERLAQSFGHADRREPLRGYLTGLVLPGARKSVEPMAAIGGARTRTPDPPVAPSSGG